MIRSNYCSDVFSLISLFRLQGDGQYPSLKLVMPQSCQNSSDDRQLRLLLLLLLLQV